MCAGGGVNECTFIVADIGGAVVVVVVGGGVGGGGGGGGGAGAVVVVVGGGWVVGRGFELAAGFELKLAPQAAAARLMAARPARVDLARRVGRIDRAPAVIWFELDVCLFYERAHRRDWIGDAVSREAARDATVNACN
jgi:hypothetical protein